VCILLRAANGVINDGDDDDYNSVTIFPGICVTCNFEVKSSNVDVG